MLEAIGAGSSKQYGDKDWADIWLDSTEFAETKRTIEQLKQEGLAMPDDTDPSLKRTCASCAVFLFLSDCSHFCVATTDSLGFWQQLAIVTRRTLISFYRSADYVRLRSPERFHISAYALPAGLDPLLQPWRARLDHWPHSAFPLARSLGSLLTQSLCAQYLQLGNSQQDMQYRLFALFYLVTLPAILIAQIEPLFLHNVRPASPATLRRTGPDSFFTSQRAIFVRESSSKMYSPAVFGLTQLIAEMPYSVICAVLFYLVFCACALLVVCQRHLLTLFR